LYILTIVFFFGLVIGAKTSGLETQKVVIAFAVLALLTFLHIRFMRRRVQF
jgi:hypothetical protein